MTRSRLLATALASALALTAAACGGAAKAGVGAAGTDGKGAMAMPAGTLAFIDANADPGSAAWKKVTALGARVPGFASLEARITQGLAVKGTGATGSYAADIKPWLGNEVAVGVVGVTLAGGKPAPQVVVYAASTDDAKAEAAVAKVAKRSGAYKGYTEYTPTSGDGVAAVGKDALLYATDVATLESAINAREGADNLAASTAYTDALAKLPADNVLVGYVDGPKVANLVQMASSLAGSAATGAAADALEKAVDQVRALRSVAMSVGADDNGLKLRVIESVDPSRKGSLPTGGSTTLLDRAPADAVAFADTTGLGAGIDEALASYRALPAFARVEQQVATATGLSLTTDILPLLSGELALYVDGTTPPHGGLILKPADAARGAKTMHALTAAITKLQPTTTFTALPGGVDGEATTTNGHQVSWLRDGDILTVGLDTGGTVPAGGLAKAPGFSRTATAAGLPGEVSGLAWVDPAGIGRLVPAGGDPKQAQALKTFGALGGLLAWTTGTASEMTLTAYLAVPPAG
jgi:hypothetical protein